MEHDYEYQNTDATNCVAALVFRTTLDDFQQVKRLIESLGGWIVYQRNAPAGSRLWITANDPREVRP